MNSGKKEMKTINVDGVDLLRDPLLNKGSAFTREERIAFDIDCLLPHSVTTMENQAKRVHEHFSRLTDDFDTYIALSSLQDRNEHLFYRLLTDNLEEYMPIVYTPTVGLATQRYSHAFRRGRGVWVTPEHKGRMRQLFESIAKKQQVELMVITDGESILGIGDQGAGGMAISVGKLALYSAGAGIYPGKTLPICLDFGTNNPELLQDEYYLGWPHARLKGPVYDELLKEFVDAVSTVFPGALLQWEDFRKDNALNIMETYINKVPSFNDDIQGTGAVALSGVMSALRVTGGKLAEQRIVIVGAGAAGLGISRQLRAAMQADSKSNTKPVIAVTDSRGLIVEQGLKEGSYKKEMAWSEEQLQSFDIGPDDMTDLQRLISVIKPHVLIGTSGQAGAFNEDVVVEMASHVERPLIMPFSNPTSHSEALPKSLYQWTDGKCLVATGSPFDPVQHNGKEYQVGQGNNVFIFPGLGLAAIVGKIRTITNDQISAAAFALSGCVSQQELDSGLLFPSVTRLLEVSEKVAIAVLEQAVEEGLTSLDSTDAIQQAIADSRWTPEYDEYVKQA